jgi:NAD-dependent dihydropyrimidine dehydrogenase PreA subunit
MLWTPDIGTTFAQERDLHGKHDRPRPNKAVPDVGTRYFVRSRSVSTIERIWVAQRCLSVTQLSRHEADRHGATSPTEPTEENSLTYVIGLGCVDVKDKTCIEQCPIDCIYEGDRMMYIHPGECIDCGACEPVCPVSAIAYETDLSDGDRVFAHAARSVFDQLGAPGGAAILGPVSDPLPVATLPSQRSDA